MSFDPNVVVPRFQPVRQPSGLQPSRGQPPVRGQQPMRGRPVSNTPPNSAPINRVPNPNFRPEVPQNNNTNNTNGISFQPMRPAPQPPVRAAQSAVGNKPALPPKPSPKPLTQPVNVVNSPVPTVPGKPPSPPLGSTTIIIQSVQQQPFQQLEAQIDAMINTKVRPAVAAKDWLTVIQGLEDAGDLLIAKTKESAEPYLCIIKASLLFAAAEQVCYTNGRDVHPDAILSAGQKRIEAIREREEFEQVDRDHLDIQGRNFLEDLKTQVQPVQTNRNPNANFRPQSSQNGNNNNFQPLRPAPLSPVGIQSTVENKSVVPRTQVVSVVQVPQSPAPTTPAKPPSPENKETTKSSRFKAVGKKVKGFAKTAKIAVSNLPSSVQAGFNELTESFDTVMDKIGRLTGMANEAIKERRYEDALIFSEEAIDLYGACKYAKFGVNGRGGITWHLGNALELCEIAIQKVLPHISEPQKTAHRQRLEGKVDEYRAQIKQRPDVFFDHKSLAEQVRTGVLKWSKEYSKWSFLEEQF